MSEGVLNRFLKYVRYNTQSVRESDTEPSSAKELVLAEELVRELKDLGITDARIGKGGVVYATIPATKGCEECPAVGFIAHMDTSPDASGTDVKPQILRFTGDDVLLNAEKKHRLSREKLSGNCEIQGRRHCLYGRHEFPRHL